MGSPSDLRLAPRSQQRGAAAVFAAISIIMGLVCIGLAVDLGRIYFAQRDLQRLANLAALDAARMAGGCVGVTADPLAVATSEAGGSVVRNGGDQGWVNVVRIGSVAGKYSVRYFATAESDKDRAVEVRLTRPAPGRLIPLFASTADTLTLSATSAAISRPRARVRVGSKLLQVSPPLLNSLLSGLTGPLSFDLVTYQNLFGARVPVPGVLDHISAGTPEQIINTQTPVDGLIDAIARALGDAGQGAAQQTAQAIRSASAGGSSVIPGNVLGVGDAGDFTADTTVTAGDVIFNALVRRRGSSLINLPAINLPPPLGSSTAAVKVLEPALDATLTPGGSSLDPQSYARNAQALVQADFPITLPGLPASNISFFIQAAQAQARVTDIHCARSGVDHDTVYVAASSGTAHIGIGRFDDPNSPNPVVQPAVLADSPMTLTIAAVPIAINVPVNVKITLSADVPIQGRAEDLQFDGPFDPNIGKTLPIGPPATQQLSNALAQLQVQPQIKVTAGDPALQAIVDAAPETSALKSALKDAVNSKLSQVLAQLGSQYIEPQLTPLGITVGGADVTVYEVLAPQPKLFTH